MSIYGQMLKAFTEKMYSYQSKAAILRHIANLQERDKIDKATLLATEIINSGATEEQAVQWILREIAAL